MQSIQERRKTRKLNQAVNESSQDLESQWLKRLLLSLVNETRSIRAVSDDIKLVPAAIANLIKSHPAFFLCRISPNQVSSPETVKLILTNKGLEHLKKL